jgi:hypothetical protein
MCCQITFARGIRQRGFQRFEMRISGGRDWSVLSVADCVLTIPDSFAHVARTPDAIEEQVDDGQGRDQDFFGGRCGTRTHDSAVGRRYRRRLDQLFAVAAWAFALHHLRRFTALYGV